MTVEFDKSFSKSIGKLSDKTLLTRLKNIIIRLEKVDTIQDFPNTRKLSGFNNYFRIKIGDYRLGIEKINDTTIRLIVFLHRKDIYKKFP